MIQSKVLMLMICVFSIPFLSARCQKVLDQSKYYKLINRAELAICDSNYKEAVGLYRKAFRVKRSYAYSKDILNFAVALSLEKRFTQSRNALELLISRGCDSEFLYSLPVLTNCSEQLSTSRKLKQKLIHNDTGKFNVKKKNYFDSLFRKDQYYRNKPDAFVIFKDSIYATDRIIAKELEKYLQTNDLPAEWEIGNTKTDFLLPSYWALIRHNMYNGQQTVFFGDYVRRAVKKKLLHPYIASSLIESSTGNLHEFHNDQVNVHIYDSTGEYLNYIRSHVSDLREFPNLEYCINYSPIDSLKLFEINLRRKAIDLEPIIEYRKKVTFSLTDKRFYFGFVGGISEWLFTEKVDFESACTKIKND